MDVVAGDSMCILTPPRLSYGSPIPWPSSGRKACRYLVPRGVFKPTKLSTKHSTRHNANHISPWGNTPPANRSFLNSDRRKSVGKLFNKFHKEVAAAEFSYRISPEKEEIFVGQPKTQKSLVKGKSSIPSPDIIDPTDSDTSPEPLFKRIHPAETYVFKETDKLLTTQDSKISTNKVEKPSEWRSCTAPPRSLKKKLSLTSSDDDHDILPLLKRLGKKSYNPLSSSESEFDVRPSTSKKSNEIILISDSDSDQAYLDNLKTTSVPKKLKTHSKMSKLRKDVFSDNTDSTSSLDKHKSKSAPKKLDNRTKLKDSQKLNIDKLSFVLDDSDSTSSSSSSSFDRRRPKSVPKKTKELRKNTLVSKTILPDTVSLTSLDKRKSNSVPKKNPNNIAEIYTNLQDAINQRKNLGDFISDTDSLSSQDELRSSIVPRNILKSLSGPTSPPPLKLKDLKRGVQPNFNSFDNKLKTPVSTFRQNINLETMTMSPSRKASELDSKSANKFVASLLQYKTLKRSEFHPEAVKYIDNFAKNKEALSQFLYSLYNKHCFDDQLPPKMVITWKPRLRNTAGFCIFRRKVGPKYNDAMQESRQATIDLSVKVLDSPDRLCNTLIHEMCHAATWIINGIKDAHHGEVWKNWGLIAIRRIPVLPPIKRTHNYEIKTKFVYRCTKCGSSIGRHSKSLDITRKVCGANSGACLGKFELLQNGKVIATATTTGGKTKVDNKPLMPFAKFVKDNYGKIRKDEAGSKHADVMKKLGKLFAEQTKITD